MRFDIRYLTRYRYGGPVTDNLNAVRVKPATKDGQRCESFAVRVQPDARVDRRADYFGTEVIEFGVPAPHEELTIDVRAEVTTAAPPDPPAGSWDGVAAGAYEKAGAEYLLQSEPAPPNGALKGLREEALAATPLATLLRVSDLIPAGFEYRPGATYVGSTTADLLEGGAGVCQDFVHLGLMLLRGQGIAARYVSGYLFAAPEDGGVESVEVHTHAWLEALIPCGGDEQPVWVGADPTNRGLAGDRHVRIGHGRSYTDVPPIKGVYRGAGLAELEARVEMHRVG